MTVYISQDGRHDGRTLKRLNRKGWMPVGRIISAVCTSMAIFCVLQKKCMIARSGVLREVGYVTVEKRR